jgi:hypothetical protein
MSPIAAGEAMASGTVEPAVLTVESADAVRPDTDLRATCA